MPSRRLSHKPKKWVGVVLARWQGLKRAAYKIFTVLPFHRVTNGCSAALPLIYVDVRSFAHVGHSSDTEPFPLNTKSTHSMIADNSSFDREAGSPPLGETFFQSPYFEATGAQQGDCLEGQYAVFATAVGDDFPVRINFG
jgi:hypothetical protein